MPKKVQQMTYQQREEYSDREAFAARREIEVFKPPIPKTHAELAEFVQMCVKWHSSRALQLNGFVAD